MDETSKVVRFLLVTPGCKLLSLSSVCEHLQLWFRVNMVYFLITLGMLLSPGLVDQTPSGVQSLKIVLSLNYGAVSLALLATSGHSQSGRCPGMLEAKSENRSALSLKLKQDYLLNFPNNFLLAHLPFH